MRSRSDDNAAASTDATTGATPKTGGMKEELPSSAPTAITATDDNGGGQAPSPVARLCRCPGTITAPKGGQKRGHSALSDRACNMTQYCSTAQFARPRQQQQQQASSSPHATTRGKTPRYLATLRFLVVLLMSAMLATGSAAGGTLTRNLTGDRYFIGGRVIG